MPTDIERILENTYWLTGLRGEAPVAEEGEPEEEPAEEPGGESGNPFLNLVRALSPQGRGPGR